MKSLLVLVLLAVAASALPIPSEELEILKLRAEHLEKALVDLEKAKIQFQGEKTEEEGEDRGAIQEVLEKIAQLERVFSLELEAVRRKIAELEGVAEITTEIPSTDDYLKSSEESEESEEKRVEEEVTTIETPTTPAWVFEEEEQKAQQIEEATNEPVSEKTELDTSEEKAKIQAEKVQELLQAAAVYKKAVYDLTINAILSYIPEEYKDFLGNVRVRDQPLLFLALHAISLHISNNYDEDEIKKIGAIATELTAADPELHVFLYKLQEFLVQQRAKWESLKESTKDRIKELIGSDHQAFSPSNAQEVLEKLDSIIAFEDDKDTQADLISHWPNLENYFNSDYLKSQIQLLRLARKSLVEYIARDGPNQEIDATEATIIEEAEKTPVEDLEGLLEEAARL